MSRGAAIVATAAELSFPRAAGTEGDARVRERLGERLAALGLPAIERAFAFNPTRPLWRVRLGLLVLATTLVLDAIEPWGDPERAVLLVRLLLAASGIGTFLLGMIWDDGILAPLPGAVETANVLATAGSAGGRPVVILAHHDTKSQNVPWVARALLGLLGALGLAALVTGVALRVAGVDAPPAAVGAIKALCGAGGLAYLVLGLISFGNHSPGALDNAGAMAVALEVAARCVAAPPEDIELTIVFTGGEERLMAGARALVRERGEGWIARGGRAIVIDGVGGPGPLGVWGRGAMARGALETARALGLAAVTPRFPVGLFTDALPLVRAGVPVVALSSSRASRAVRAIHTVHDVPENLDPQALAAAADLVEALVRGS